MTANRTAGRPTRLVALCLSLAMLAAAPLPARADDKAPPIIPGAQGFGLETPAGSGRNLLALTLPKGWDATLVARWDFDNGVPEGGALSGAAKLVARDKGQALRLDGNGALKLTNPAGALKPGADFTIMGWMCLEAPKGLLARSTTKAGGYWDIGHQVQGQSKWMFRARGDDKGAYHLAWRQEIATPRWRHIAGVYEAATGTLRYYMNGVPLSRTTNEKIKAVAATQSTDLLIGSGVKGLVDDVMLFGSALTDEQITALYADQLASYLGYRGPAVYRVTNLNPAGPGSLRDALEEAGPRTIVFEVSGNIDFSPYTALPINSPYVTIAGETAPSPGITLKACEVMVNTHDVLVRHIRVRTGDLDDPTRPIRDEKSGWTQFSERDTMKVSGDRIVFDHCSFSWSTDENVQSNASDLTFRHCIFSEGLNSPKHHKGAHSKGLLLRGVHNTDCQNVAVIGNLFAHNHGRNPRVAGPCRAALINNVTYDVWIAGEVGIMGRAKNQDADPLHISTWIGNVVIEGEYGRTFIPDYRGDEKVVEQKRVPSDDTVMAFWFLDTGSAVGPPRSDACKAGKVFVDDLRVLHRDRTGAYTDHVVTDVLHDRYVRANTIWMGGKWTLHPERSLVKEPSVVVPGLEILPSEKVEAWVMSSVGARPKDRDPVDARVIKSVVDRTGTIPKSQDDFGGWPALAENHRALTVPENPSADDDGDGYTNLEQWLHGFAKELE